MHSVRRDELTETHPEPNDEADAADALDRLRKLSGLTYQEPAETETHAIDHDSTNDNAKHDTVGGDVEMQDGMAFRLFAPAPTTNDTNETQQNRDGVHLIRLRSPTPTSKPSGPAGFLPGRGRPHEYYFSEISALRQAEYNASAVSGQFIRERADQSWPGMAYAWKVVHLPTTMRMNQRNLHDEISKVKRTRIGKKARIKKRITLRAQRVEVEKNAQAKEVKDRDEREKRARRNREKKLKKRARDKSKKVGAALHDGDSSGVED